MENRKHKREKRRISLTIDNNASIMLDISLDGMRIMVPYPPKKRIINIQVAFREKAIMLKGHIHWIKKKLSQYRQYELGVSILHPPEEYLYMVENIVLKN